MGATLRYDSPEFVRQYYTSAKYRRGIQPACRCARLATMVFHSAGNRFAMVVNYDGVYIDPLVIDYHAERIVYVEEEFYTSCTRYSGGAFLRMKLGKALEKRKVAPHLFESDKQARKALAKYLKDLSEIKTEKDGNVVSITGKN